MTDSIHRTSHCEPFEVMLLLLTTMVYAHGLPMIALGNGNDVDAPRYDPLRSGESDGFLRWWKQLASACDDLHGDESGCTLWDAEHALLGPRCPVNCRIAPRPTTSELNVANGVLQIAGKQWRLPEIRNRQLFCIESEPRWRVSHCSTSARTFAARPDATFRFSWFSRYYIPDGGAEALLVPSEVQRAQFKLPRDHKSRNTLTRKVISVWFHHCNTDQSNVGRTPTRTRLLKSLHTAGLQYASYGKCGRNVPLNDFAFNLNGSRTKWQNKEIGMRRHPFALVSENSAYPGWVTEKVYQALAAGVVPVWIGTPNGWAERYLLPIVPPGSVVVASQYPTLAALAQFITRAATNSTLYESLHSWRVNPQLLNKSIAVLRGELAIAFEATLCRACQELHAYPTMNSPYLGERFLNWLLKIR